MMNTTANPAAAEFAADILGRFGMIYLPELPGSPAEIPAGMILMHNHVYPVARVHGTRGSRYWLQDPAHPGAPAVEPCPCPWAAGLGQHHRRNLAAGPRDTAEAGAR